MGYQLTPNDIGANSPPMQQSQNGYQLTPDDVGPTPLSSALNIGAQYGSNIPGIGGMLQFLNSRVGRDVGAGIAQQGINGANELGGNIQQDPNQMFGVNNPSGADQVVKNIGGFLPYSIGTEGAGAIAKGLELAPALIRSIQGAANIGGSSAYGAVSNPNDPEQGALKGAAFGAAGEALPYALPAAGALLSPIRPEPIMGKIRALLSQGMGIEDTGKSIANDVNTAKNYQTGLASQRYNNVFNQIPEGAKITDTFPLENQQYNAIDPNIPNTYGYKLAATNQNYLKNPTFQNAHELQSDLGKAQYRIDNTPNSTYADQNISEGLGIARNAVKADMGNYLNSIKPGLGDEYNSASDFYKENVVPYNEDPRVSALANQLNTNPRSISAIFKNPSEGLQKVVGDMDGLGLNTSNKILSPSLARVAVTRTPENMTAAIGKLDEWGLGSYRTPEFNQLADTLKSRLNLRNGAQQFGGAAAAVGTALHTGAGNGLEPLAAFELGARWIPGTMRTLGRIGTPLYQGSQAALSPLYPHIAKALIANMVPGGQR